ncbi:MAG: ABC transporter substrate-binding protein [Clostridia bacterium]
MKRLFALLLVFTLVLTTLAGCSSGTTPDSAAPAAEAAKDTTPLKIGTIYPLSGSNALLGTQTAEGVKIAVNMVNRNGGVQGRQVELISADAPDPTAATTEAGRLIDQQGVKIIFGSLASGNALAISAVTEKSGVILMESGGITDELTNKGFKNVYRIIDRGGFRGAQGAKYINEVIASKLGMKPEELKIAIVNEDSSYGTSVASGAVNKLKELGMNVVLHESYNAKVTDMSAMVMKIKDAKPDVLIATSYVNDAVLLIDTLKQYKAMPKVFMGTGAGTTDPNFAKTIGADTDGMFALDMPTNLPIEHFAKYPELQAVVKEFRETFLKAHPDMSVVPVAAEASFAGAYHFLNDIVAKAKSTAAADIRAAALSAELPMTSLGFGMKLGEDGQNQLAAANVGQWQNGKVVTVYPEDRKNGEVINIPLPIANK